MGCSRSGSYSHRPHLPDIDTGLEGLPIFFFYDCEATGPNPVVARIIEIAAVVYTKHLEHSLPRSQIRRLHFESLCHCTSQVHPDAEKKHGLSLASLQDQPTFASVLNSFCDWIKDVVQEVGRVTGKTYTPILVAHSGIVFDFPLLMAEVERIRQQSGSSFESQLVRKFDNLNLNFADTFFMCKDLEMIKSPILEGVDKLGVEGLYKHFFPHKLYAAHRALPDAKALCKLFSDSDLSDTVDCELLNTLRNSQEIRDKLKKQQKKYKKH